MTIDEMKEISKQFCEEFMFSDSDSVINCVGISTLKVLKKKFEGFEDKDFCLSVGFSKKPSKGTVYPDVYKGVPVDYKVVGKIRPL